MSEEWYLVKADTLRELLAVGRRFTELQDELLDDAMQMIPARGSKHAVTSETARVEGTSGTVDPEGTREYEIGLRNDQYGYDEVAALELDRDVFSLDWAWDRLEPLVQTDAKRPRDAFRQSLDRSDRFERVDRDEKGVWWRRVDGEGRSEHKVEQSRFGPKVLES